MIIEEAICDAIETIVDQRLATAGFNRTIQGTIVSSKAMEDEILMQYKIDYQGITLRSFGVSGYQKGDYVHILLINNDITQTSFIIGKVDYDYYKIKNF